MNGGTPTPGKAPPALFAYPRNSLGGGVFGEFGAGEPHGPLGVERSFPATRVYWLRLTWVGSVRASGTLACGEQLREGEACRCRSRGGWILPRKHPERGGSGPRV